MQTIDTASLDQLLIDLNQAKEVERKARENRIAVEEQIIGMVGAKEEGSKTVTAIHYKVRLVGKLSRRVDWPQYDEVVTRASLPASLLPVKLSRVLDVKKLETLEKDYPALHREIEQCITVAPQKIQVSIEQIEG